MNTECVCRGCGNHFVKTDNHFSENFCSEECLNTYLKETIAQAKLVVEIVKLSVRELEAA